MSVMPTLTDADCIGIYRKRDLLNRVTADSGFEPPRYGPWYVVEIHVNDGLGHDLESRQYIRIDGLPYRVREWQCGQHLDGYRYLLERVNERPTNA